MFSKYLLNRSIKGHQGSKVFIKTAPSPGGESLPHHALCCVQEGRRWQVQRHLLEAFCSCSSKSLMRSHLTLQAFQVFWYFPFVPVFLQVRSGAMGSFVPHPFGPFRDPSRLCREDQDGDRRLRCGKIVLFINR